MTTQPEALRLADYMDDALNDTNNVADAASAELRRLHAECNDLAHQLNESNERNGRLKAQRDALLEALKEITPSICHVSIVPEEKCAQCGRIARARAAIKAVEGEMK